MTTIKTFTTDFTPAPKTSTVSLSLLSAVALAGREEYIGVAPSGEIYRFGPRVHASAPSTQTITTTQSKSTSIWQEMFGRDAFLDELAPPPSTVVLPPTLAKPTDVFDGPSHTLPPVSLLFDAFLGQLLKPSLEQAAKPPAASAAAANATMYATGDDNDDDAAAISEKAGKSGGQGLVRIKAVSDEDVKELEGFFKDLLSDAPASAASTQADTAARMANGDTPLKSAPALTSTPKPKQKVKANGSAPPNGASHDTPQSEESREKKHSKKRRAPKE